MRKFFYLFQIKLVFIFSFLLIDCSSSYRYFIKTSKNDNFYFKDGKKIVIKKKKNILVTAESYKNGNEIILHLSFKNDSEKPVNIIPNKIKLFEVASGKLHYLNTYSYGQYLKKLKEEHNTTTAIYTLSYVTSAIGSSYDYNEGETTTYEDAHGNVLLKSKRRNSLLEEEIKDRKDRRRRKEKVREMEELINRQNKEIEYYRKNYLKNNTLFPGQTYKGFIIIKEEKKLSKFFCRIPIEEEFINFQFIKLKEN